MDLEHHLSNIDQVGYAILNNLIPSSLVTKIKQELAPFLEKQLMGRNNFEGFASERVYALLSKSPSVAELVEHEFILKILDQLLEPTYLLSANLAINVHPGETSQPFHADHASLPNDNRTKTNGISVIWALDDFTSSNGATEVVPGSHKWQHTMAEQKSQKLSELVQVEMSAGSALVFHGSLYHRGGANQAQTSRLAITPQYCQPWLRQLENMVLAVPPEKARQYSSRVQELLGYSIRNPGFMGYVDGVHPKRLIDEGYQGRKARGIPS